MTEFDQIISPKKEISELVEWLRERVDVTENSLSDFPKYYASRIPYNAIHCLQNQEIKAGPDDLEFLCYRLEKTPRNEAYNQVLPAIHQEFIYVVMEKKTGYILSNSNKLFLELSLLQGVTQEDIDNDTLYMKAYRANQKFYQEGSY